MSNTASINDTLDGAKNGARRVGNEAIMGAERVRRTASSELGNLISDVEDLLKKVANVADVDVAKLRERVQEKLDTAKESLAAGSKRITETARDAAGATDGYVRQSPWQAVGFAALAGVAVGYLISRR
jgi:ElaB/YqjD/DUF883 family membrane-anchored ribosome-binding protein